MEASRSKSLPNLEEDLDRLFKIRDKGATARRGLPVLDYDSDSNEEDPSTTSRRRIWIIYDKSEEDLDHLGQVGGGFGSSTTSRRRIWIAYYKSEEDLDHLLQVGEGLTNIHRRAPVRTDYSDFINDATTFTKWP
jgi:hypothetical protein